MRSYDIVLVVVKNKPNIKDYELRPSRTLKSLSTDNIQKRHVPQSQGACSGDKNKTFVAELEAVGSFKSKNIQNEHTEC